MHILKSLSNDFMINISFKSSVIVVKRRSEQLSENLFHTFCFSIFYATSKNAGQSCIIRFDHSNALIIHLKLV